MAKFKAYILIILSFLAILSVHAIPSRPQVRNIFRSEYGGDNKNWAIGQDERSTVYFGNDSGLLEFDGISWSMNTIPNSSIIRSLSVESYQTIFTGGYEEFGRWDRDISGRLIYTSLSGKLAKGVMKNDDIWKIWIADSLVYFQSFNAIYTYDYKDVKKISGNKNFLLLSKVRDELITQEIKGGLYRIIGSEMHKIEGSDFFQNTDVRMIIPYGKSDYLIGTTTKGIYIYDGSTLKEWNKELSKVMNDEELNCGLLSARGTYVIGTILGGIYEVDLNGNIINHISPSTNSLQNNTVLSLYEDHAKNIWVAMDRGIAYLKYMENLNFHADPTGFVGSIYDAVEWNDKLFIGSNQGVFYISKSDLSVPDIFSKMKFINGTQGQVWSLKIVNNRLFCSHNLGLKEIRPNLSVSNLFSDTGIYHVTESQINNQNVLFLSSYSSLRIMDIESGDVHILKDIPDPIMNTEIDHLGNIWLEHANKGIYRCKISTDLKQFHNYSYYGGNNQDDLPYKMRIFKIGGRVVLLGDNRFYTYDDIGDQIVPNTLLNECFTSADSLGQIIHIKNDLYWATAKTSIYKFIYDGYIASILESYDLGTDNLSLVNEYENIAILNDSANLVCLDHGLLLYQQPVKVYENENRPLPLPYIKAFAVTNNKGDTIFNSLSENIEISDKYNTMNISFSSSDVFSSNLSFEYMLKDIDLDWSDAKKINMVSYARLSKGKYEFLLRTVDNSGKYSEPISVHFEILPPWHETIWAKGLLLLAIGIILYISWELTLRRYRNLHLQKIRHRETKRLRVLTENLQREVETKNAELLTQTSFIIQKNELIFKMKNIVDEFYEGTKNKSLLPLHQKINALLNNSIDSEEDWKMFLLKFEEKHAGFFKKMKSIYPELTSSDLRLCACLKLNLETKEIASLMNLSVRAVENNRYRLRKKLNLEPSSNLNDFILSTT